jgi:hypothetical protein
MNRKKQTGGMRYEKIFSHHYARGSRDAGDASGSGEQGIG